MAKQNKGLETEDHERPKTVAGVFVRPTKQGAAGLENARRSYMKWINFSNSLKKLVQTRINLKLDAGQPFFAPDLFVPKESEARAPESIGADAPGNHFLRLSYLSPRNPKHARQRVLAQMTSALLLPQMVRKKIMVF